MINPDELLFVVDENHNQIEPKSRAITHANRLWHRTSQIFVTDGKGNVLCQQRSLKKDSFPGKWEPFFGGHLAAGTSYESGAIIELNEELGISLNAANLIFFRTFKFTQEYEFCGGVLYVLGW